MGAAPTPPPIAQTVLAPLSEKPLPSGPSISMPPPSCIEQISPGALALGLYPENKKIVLRLKIHDADRTAQQMLRGVRHLEVHKHAGAGGAAEFIGHLEAELSHSAPERPWEESNFAEKGGRALLIRPPPSGNRR